MLYYKYIIYACTLLQVIIVFIMYPDVICDLQKDDLYNHTPSPLFNVYPSSYMLHVLRHASPVLGPREDDTAIIKNI